MDQSNNHSGVVNGWINDDWEQFGSLGEISTQAGMNKESQRLTPDDLLSLLATVIVHSVGHLLAIRLQLLICKAICFQKMILGQFVCEERSCSMGGVRRDRMRTVVVVEVGGEVGVLGQKNLHKITVSSNLIRICLMVPGSIVCNILLEISK
ncbi:hypothetical protein PPACK8108_LOCUS17197 [Phakopsora pachyrhizi]|uniref:Uncharacterized protein n=1 Tax=Phakopsora pachyrhizi TaxID=170000 RepID=A0AAV0BBL1_PHAPC|nr:hypothetical protein PPACK8108_LOCUS17197 [Phakopsora pachyrhizi]